MIEVRRISEGGALDFEVVVREGEGETRHHVTMSREVCERLTAGKHTPERCLEAAFRFLLDREPKESILGRFDERRFRAISLSSNGRCHVIFRHSESTKIGTLHTPRIPPKRAALRNGVMIRTWPH